MGKKQEVTRREQFEVKKLTKTRINCQKIKNVKSEIQSTLKDIKSRINSTENLFSDIQVKPKKLFQHREEKANSSEGEVSK